MNAYFCVHHTCACEYNTHVFTVHISEKCMHYCYSSYTILKKSKKCILCLALGTVGYFPMLQQYIILAAFYESDHQQVIIGKMHG